MGNSFIIVMIGSHRQLQRPSHILLGCLASTDLLLGLTVMVPRLVTELSGGKWVFGFLLCQGYHAMDVTLSTASILHLSCISIDRYFAIVHRPLLYHSRVTPCRVVLASFFCWILSSLTGFVPVFTGIYTSMEHLEKARLNPADCADLVVNKYFSVVAGIISFWLPGSIMVYVYCKVYKETMRLRREERKVTVSLRESPKAAAAASMACKNSVDGDRNSKTAVLSRHFCPQSWKLSNGTSSKATDKKKCKFKYGKKASISVKEESNENAIEVEIVEEEQERREEQTSAQIQKQQQRINRERESGYVRMYQYVYHCHGMLLMQMTPYIIDAIPCLLVGPLKPSVSLWVFSSYVGRRSSSGCRSRLCSS